MLQADLSRILIIKPSSLGDVVQALPVATALRDLSPSARIDWLVTPSCAGVVEGQKTVDHVVLFERGRYGRMWRNPRSMASFLWFMARLRRPRYTTVIDLQGLFRSGFLCLATGARRRIGLSDAREGADRFYTDIVRVPPGPLSSVDRYLLAAIELGAPPDTPPRFELEIPPRKTEAARKLLAEGGLAGGQGYVVLIPGARWSTKRWPEERFAAVAQRVQEQLKLAPVLVGATADSEISGRMKRMRGNRMVDLIGRTDLKTLAAVLAGAACVVTGDTGPMHLAAAVGRPIVALFGPTSVEATGPYGPGHIILADRADCARCDRRNCLWEGQSQEMVCLRNISVDDVFEAVRMLIAPDRPDAGGAGRGPGRSREE